MSNDEKEEKNMKFKIGDKVKHKEFGVGEVKHINKSFFLEQSAQYPVEYAVEFQEKNKKMFHSCSGNCKLFYGYWCTEENLELIEAAPQNTEKSLNEPQLKNSYLNEPQFPVNTPDPLKLLKIKNKKLQARIHYLEGQVKVYEDFLRKVRRKDK